jgi:hypothetical protein
MYGCNFIFGNVNSEQYGVFICKINDSGNSADEINFGNDIEIVSDIVYGNLVPYIYGIKSSNTLQFDLTIASKEKIDVYDKSAISQWLFEEKFKWLHIIQPDMEDIWYYCMMKDKKLVNVAGYTYGLTFTVVCDAPYAWTKEYTKTFETTDNNATDFTFINTSDDMHDLLPTINIKLGSSQTSIKITNNSNSGKNNEIKLTDLVAGDEINIDCKRQIITANATSNILDKSNLKFLGFIQGVNNLTITGIATITMTYRFARKVGV